MKGHRDATNPGNSAYRRQRQHDPAGRRTGRRHRPTVASLAQPLARQPARLVLDLTDLRFCDCTGFSLLVQTRNALPHGSELVLHGATTQLLRLLRITRVDTTLTLA